MLASFYLPRSATGEKGAEERKANCRGHPKRLAAELKIFYDDRKNVALLKRGCLHRGGLATHEKNAITHRPPF